MSYPVVWASEISDYLYCRRSWWLRRTLGRESFNSAELARGTAFHDTKGRLARRASAVQSIALLFIFFAVTLLTYWLVSVR